MTGENGASKLRTLADLTDAMSEAVGGKCDRCRRDAGTLTLNATLREPRTGKGAGIAPAAAQVRAVLCEPCAVDILAVVGRAVGKVAA